MLTYYHLWRMNPREARPYRIPWERILIKDYQETQSYSRTAKNFSTHRRIVRKWVRRYQEQGEPGLESLPPIPKSQPTRLDPQLERLILRLRDCSGFGPQRLHYWLKRSLKIVIAISTIPKYLHKHKRTKKHLKRGIAKSLDPENIGRSLPERTQPAPPRYRSPLATLAPSLANPTVPLRKPEAKPSLGQP